MNTSTAKYILLSLYSVTCTMFSGLTIWYWITKHLFSLHIFLCVGSKHHDFSVKRIFFYPKIFVDVVLFLFLAYVNFESSMFILKLLCMHMIHFDHIHLLP